MDAEYETETAVSEVSLDVSFANSEDVLAIHVHSGYNFTFPPFIGVR